MIQPRTLRTLYGVPEGERGGWAGRGDNRQGVVAFDDFFVPVSLSLCVCVYIFIKLCITAQSGPVILVIVCHSHWSSQGRSMILITKSYD